MMPFTTISIVKIKYSDFVSRLLKDPALNGLCFLLIIIFSGFFIFDTSLHRFIFYGTLIAGLVHMNTSQSIKPMIQNHRYLIYITGAYLLYNFVSVFWTNDFGIESFFSAFKIPIFISVFVFSFASVIKLRPSFLHILEASYVITAVVSVLYILLFHFPDNFHLADLGKWSLRLQGTGRGVNSNIFAQLLSFAILITIFGAPVAPSCSSGKIYVCKTLLFLLFSIIVLLGGGRGAMLALFITLIITSFFRRDLFSVSLSLALLVCSALFLLVTPEIWGNLYDRGDSFRVEIWQQVWDLIREAPILGHGIGYEFSFATSTHHVHSSAHNIILGVLLYGGFIGLFIFALLGLSAIVGAYQLGRRENNWLPFALLIYGGIVMQISGHTIFLNLNREWWISWIPLAYLLAWQPARLVQGNDE